MMLSNLKQSTWSVASLAMWASFSFGVMSTEVAAADFDRPVFEFQSKMANKGNARAQYFLAKMYEEGRGTKANAEQARHWYEQAKLNGYTPEEQVAAIN